MTENMEEGQVKVNLGAYVTAARGCSAYLRLDHSLSPTWELPGLPQFTFSRFFKEPFIDQLEGMDQQLEGLSTGIRARARGFLARHGGILEDEEETGHAICNKDCHRPEPVNPSTLFLSTPFHVVSFLKSVNCNCTHQKTVACSRQPHLLPVPSLHLYLFKIGP